MTETKQAVCVKCGHREGGSSFTGPCVNVGCKCKCEFPDPVGKGEAPEGDVLKPCPFCGNKNPSVDDGLCEDGSWVVWCHNECKSGGAFKAEREDAIAAWNRRVDSPFVTTLRARVAELEGERAKDLQALGSISDAADAAYLDNDSNTYIHDIFNIVAARVGITRRLPDENGPNEL